MKSPLRKQSLLGGVGLLAAATLFLSACSGDTAETPSAPSDDASATPAAELTYVNQNGQCDVEPREGVDYEGARELIERFQAGADSLLQTDPLPEPIDPNTTVAFLNNDTAISGIMYEHMVNAAEAAGVTLVNVSTGTDAQSINSALNSVVEMKPDILINVSLDAQFFQDQLQQLQDQGTAVVYASQVNAENFGLDDTLGGRNASIVNGKVLAAAAVAYTCGTGTDFVLYSIPELAFSEIVREAVDDELAEYCEECNLRVVDISIIDPSPADLIVSDLQAHPETDFFLTTADQFQIGLKEKADLAGLTNAWGFGQGSLPPNLVQISEGSQAGAQAVDFNMFMWALLDEGLRKDMDVWEEYTDWLTVGQVTSRILTQDTAGEFIDGFESFPGMEEAYKELWGK